MSVDIFLILQKYDLIQVKTFLRDKKSFLEYV